VLHALLAVIHFLTRLTLFSKWRTRRRTLLPLAIMSASRRFNFRSSQLKSGLPSISTPVSFHFHCSSHYRLCPIFLSIYYSANGIKMGRKTLSCYFDRVVCSFCNTFICSLLLISIIIDNCVIYFLPKV
jgi:hypothetical protein